MSAHREALERLFNTVAPAPSRSRRLDVAALKVAARAAGFLSEYDAVREALSGRINGDLVADVLGGIVPGSVARLFLATTLGVSEFRIWPRVDEARVA